MFQRAAQVDRAVGFAKRAAVGLAVDFDAAGAVVRKPVHAVLVGGKRCRHLEHRPHAEGGKCTVDQRGIVGADAAGHIAGVVLRHADAC